ncbi:conserved hypothetical protein [Thermoplasma acidophilum]|uniref:PIN domain-containing protein n=1 Tax=Thermoplasma acidophilum (strain ATCC 25905 / DSM 1728 / JCM 9062 / NBRC 15155 / AMRC-C165) TaxID=273075 RepID=Q9HK43_THEAC|nr:PIN domain-containing protein [Thermoplasma acidophilum]CAC11896.1 conserved hypothetical protein [Thermoplasma acidophilum]
MKSNFAIVDTNVIIYAMKSRVRLDELVLSLSGIARIAIPECVIYELRKLSAADINARIGLQYAMQHQVLKSEGHGDECILKAAIKYGCPVITNDREFIEVLKRNHVVVATLSGRKLVRMN